MMRHVLAVAVAAGLAAPAMAKDLAAGLTGHWTVDKAAAIEAAAPPFYKSATPEKQKELLADMMKSMPDMVLDFTATTMSMKPGSEAPQLATYKVTKQEKDTIWADVTPQKKGGGTEPAAKFTFQFVDPNTVKMVSQGDPPLVLKRSK